MPVPATANGSPDVNGKEQDVTTPDPRPPQQTPASVCNSWREILHSGADCAQIEGFTLEYLIDFQRQRGGAAGEGR